MATRSVIVELAADPELIRQATSSSGAALDTAALAHLPALRGDVAFDPNFAPVALPATAPWGTGDGAASLTVDLTPERATYIVRAELDDGQIGALRGAEGVAGVFSDARVERCLTCIDSPALGDDDDVERLLDAARLRACAMTGRGVRIAIVDTGLNIEYLEGRGKRPAFSLAESWGYAPGLPLGAMPADHGTMCAFDACIAAPECTLVDVALLRPFGGGLGALLSDAVRAYAHLREALTGPLPANTVSGLVVSNSWGMFHPSWDLPPGNPGNYSDNPNHPFNRAVGALEALGADVLFAAGNCGPQCPDERCLDVSENAIYGANGHPQVLSVAGVDTNAERVGYSAIGPGRLAERKPDVCGYTHFEGSGVFAADAGTSAAAPLVAGVVAAIRSKRPYDAAQPATSPAAIRTLVTATARDLGSPGFDVEHGFGVVDGAALYRELCDEAAAAPGAAPSAQTYS